MNEPPPPDPTFRDRVETFLAAVSEEWRGYVSEPLWRTRTLLELATQGVENLRECLTKPDSGVSWTAPEVELQYAVEYDWERNAVTSGTFSEQDLGDNPDAWADVGERVFLSTRNFLVLRYVTREALVRRHGGVALRYVPKDVVQRVPSLAASGHADVWDTPDAPRLDDEALAALEARYRPFVLSERTIGGVTEGVVEREWERLVASGTLPHPLPAGVTARDAWDRYFPDEVRTALVYQALDAALAAFFPTPPPTVRLTVSRHNGTPVAVSLVVAFHPLVVDHDKREAYFPIVVSLVVEHEADRLDQWIDDERSAIWTGLALALAAIQTQLDEVRHTVATDHVQITDAAHAELEGHAHVTARATATLGTGHVTPPPSSVSVPPPAHVGKPAPERRYLLDTPHRILYDKEIRELVAHAGGLRLPRKFSAVPKWDDLKRDEVERLLAWNGEAAYTDQRTKTTPNAPAKLLQKQYHDDTYTPALTAHAETELRNTVGYRGFREIRRDKDGVQREYLVKRFKVGGGYVEAALTWYHESWPLVDEGVVQQEATVKTDLKQLGEALPFDDLPTDLQDRLDGRLRQLGAIRDGKRVMEHLLEVLGRDGRNPVEVPVWQLRTLLECENDRDGFARVEGCLRALSELRFELKRPGLHGQTVDAGVFLAHSTYTPRASDHYLRDGTFSLTISPYFVGCLKVFENPTASLRDTRYDWTKALSKDERAQIRGRHLRGFSALASFFDRASGFTEEQSRLRQFLEHELTLKKDPCAKTLHGRDVQVRSTAKDANDPRLYGATFCHVLDPGQTYHGALGHFGRNPEAGRKLSGTPTSGSKTSGGHTAGLLREMGYDLPPGAAKRQRNEIVRTALQDLRAVVEEAFGGVVAGRFERRWYSLDEATKELPVEVLQKEVAWFLFLAHDWRGRVSQKIEDYHAERFAQGEIPYTVAVTTDRTLAARSDEERTALPLEGDRHEAVAAIPLRLRLLAARERLKLSQEAVGKVFGVSKKTVKTWEKGQKALPLDVIPLVERWVRDATPPTPDELAALAVRRALRPGVRKQPPDRT